MEVLADRTQVLSFLEKDRESANFSQFQRYGSFCEKQGRANTLSKRVFAETIGAGVPLIERLRRATFAKPLRKAFFEIGHLVEVHLFWLRGSARASAPGRVCSSCLAPVLLEAVFESCSA